MTSRVLAVDVGATKVADFLVGSAVTVPATRRNVVTVEASGVRGIYVKRKIFTEKKRC
jgi:hypothetical protein